MENLKPYATELSAVLKRIADCQGVCLDENLYHPTTVLENLVVRKPLPNRDGNRVISLEEDYEYAFFYNVHHDEREKSFYHYTSLGSLFHILNSGKLHLNSLTALNDKSEINYVNNYMLGPLEKPYNSLTMSYHNYHFVFCFSELKDHLNQWRWYGDNAKGVMLEFVANRQNTPYKNVLWSNVRYDLGVFQVIKEWLSYSREQFKISFAFYAADYWKFFYKNPAYKDEKEIRLLIKNTNGDNHKLFEEYFKLSKYGIISPYIEVDCMKPKSELITLKSIMLGPNFPEPELNVSQLKYMLNRKNSGDVQVGQSEINHYR